MRVLLVEDDPLIAQAITAGLRRERFGVEWVAQVGAAKTALMGEPFSAIVLDLGLPDADGGALIAHLRAAGDRTPILVATARGGLAARVQGLDAGADDYLVKPFDLDELSARLRALIRRTGGHASSVLVHGAIHADLARRRVSVDAVPVDVSAREWTVLLALLERPGTVLSRRQLEERVYGWGEEVASNAIEVHVHALRRKLGAQAIVTVRGQGYALSMAP